MSVYDLSVPRRPAIEPAHRADPDDTAVARRRPGVSVFALLLIAGMCYAIGWVAACVAVPAAAGIRWMLAAIATGWDDASTSWSEDRRIEP